MRRFVLACTLVVTLTTPALAQTTTSTIDQEAPSSTSLPTPPTQPGNPGCTVGSACPPTPLPDDLPAAEPGLSTANRSGAAGVAQPAPAAPVTRAVPAFTG